MLGSATARSSIITEVMWELHFFFFTAPATTKIYTLSLHDALPISKTGGDSNPGSHHLHDIILVTRPGATVSAAAIRSEEHTSELQSRRDLVCRLLLEKKK